jgi:hypothetical protein
MSMDKEYKNFDEQAGIFFCESGDRLLSFADQTQYWKKTNDRTIMRVVTSHDHKMDT